MFIVGLTGNIATGKSTVSAIFRRRGAYIVDVDQIIQSLQKPNSPVTKRIVSRWPSVGCKKGDMLSIDRPALASIVFGNRAERQALERIMFLPTVLGIMKRVSYGVFCQRGIVIIDHPYLFESKALKWLFSRVIVVSVPREVQRQRLQQRNPTFTEAHIEQRVSNQLPLEEKVKQADFVVDNAGSVEDTEEMVTEILEKLVEIRWQRTSRLGVALVGFGVATALWCVFG